MQNAIIQRSVLAEARIVATPAIGQTYLFDPIQEIALNNILVYGIIGYSSTQLVTSPQNRPVVPVAGIPSLSMTLCTDKAAKIVWRMPVYDTVRSLNGGFVATFNDIPINLTQCYIEVMSTTGLTLGDSFVCELLYKYKPLK
jgi:hypothetical protein